MKIKIRILTCVAVLLLSCSAKTYAADNSKNLICRSGEILSLNITDQSPHIINVNKYEPHLEITKDIGYATVKLMLDQGRTLGIYDYTLIDQNGKKFNCIALQNNKGVFDAEKWVIKKSATGRECTMLFKIQKPQGAWKFNLHFNLPVGKTKDLPIIFQKPRPAPAPAPVPAPVPPPVKKPKTVQPPVEKKAPPVTHNKIISEKKIGEWDPSKLKVSWSDLSFKVPPEFADRIVGVLFSYTRGSRRLDIQSVSLMDGDKTIAIDKHTGFAGTPSRGNKYLFDQKQAVTQKDNCTIHAQVQAPPQSFGNVFILIEN
jgi:hypothetical protein